MNEPIPEQPRPLSHTLRVVFPEPLEPYGTRVELDGVDLCQAGMIKEVRAVHRAGELPRVELEILASPVGVLVLELHPTHAGLVERLVVKRDPAPRLELQALRAVLGRELERLEELAEGHDVELRPDDGCTEHPIAYVLRELGAWLERYA